MNFDSTTLLKTLLEASWQASLIILLILLLRPLLGLRVPARWRSVLWTLALLRLLVPAFLLPPSPASLQNIAAVDRPFEQAALAFHQPAPLEPATLPLLNQGPAGDDAESASSAPTVVAPHRIPWLRIAFAIWLTGSLAVTAWIVLATLRLRRRVLHHAAPVAASVDRVWRRCCERLAITHPPGLLAARSMDAPALLGLWRPVLLVPEGADFSESDWEHIFLHELAHCRRRDHWWQGLQLLALCVHWFNPLVWFGFRFLRADRELAADEWALRHLEGGGAMAYGETLLRVLSAQARLPLTPGLIGLAEDGAQIKQRLQHIVGFSRRRLAGTTVGIGLAVAFMAMVMGRQPGEADLTPYEGLAPAETLVTAARNGDRPVVERMLSEGVDVNSIAKIKGEQTALAAAVATNQLEIVRRLLEKGADLQLKPEKGETPLVVALKNGWKECAEELMHRGALCEPEKLAAAHGDMPPIDALLASGSADFEKLRSRSVFAAANGQAAVFARLADGAFDMPVHLKMDFGDGAGLVAVARGKRAVLEEMIKREIGFRDGVSRLAPAAAQAPGMREWLVTHGFKVPEYTVGEQLIEATEKENLPEMRRLLAAGASVNYQGESGWTPLTKAATWGCPKAVKLLLQKGAAPNVAKSPGWNYSALSLTKATDIADLLFAAGANVNARLYARDVHIVYYAVSNGNQEMVQWFIDHGVDVTKVRGEGPTLLFDAGSAEVVEKLVGQGVDVRAKDDQGATALHRVLQMRRNSGKIVAALLKAGADPNARMIEGSTPLMCAPDGECVDALVAAGADLHAKNDAGRDVLSAYVPLLAPSRLAALERHGLKADPQQNATLLTNAIFRHALGEVKALLARGVDPRVTAPPSARWNQIPSHLAVAVLSGEVAIAKMLREAGADDVGLLSEAAANGDLERMRVLLDQGSSADERSPQGMTALRFAVQRSQVGAVKLLLERGANVNLFDDFGFTAPILAELARMEAEEGHHSPFRGVDLNEGVKSLQEIDALFEARKPDVNFRDATGGTALMKAAEEGSFPVMSFLIKRGAEADAQRKDGMTALMLAISNQPKEEPRTGPRSIEMTDPVTKVTERYSARGCFAKTLLERNLNLDLKNQAGKTAWDLAVEKGNEEMLELLKKAKK